jgi:hypothetical protein
MTTAAQRQLDKDLAKTYKIMDAMSDIAAPKALTSTLNKVGAKVKTRTTSKVAKSVRARVKDVKPRVRMRRARWDDLKTYGSLKNIIHGYAKPLPAIRLAIGRSSKLQYATKNRPKGGIKLAGHFFPNAFIQLIHSNNKVHMLVRKQKATWKSPGVRAPTDVVKIPLQPAMEQHLPDAAKHFMKRDFDRILKHEFEIYLDREIKKFA